MSGVFSRESYRSFSGEPVAHAVRLGHWTSAADCYGARHFLCCEAWDGDWGLDICTAASGLCPENLDDLLRRMA